MSAIEIEDQIQTLASDELRELTVWFVPFELKRQEEARGNEAWTDSVLKNLA
jgi:hypothetical protein